MTDICSRSVRFYAALRLKALEALISFVYTIISRRKVTAIANTLFVTFHFILIVAVLTITAATFTHTRSLTLFSLHPICMSIGMLCIGEGLVSYKNKGLLDVFSPIMQHSRKVKARTIHRNIQSIGIVFLMTGTTICTLTPHTIHPIHTTHTLPPIQECSLLLVHVSSIDDHY